MFILAIYAYDDVFLIYLTSKSILDIESNDDIGDLALNDIDTVQKLALKEGINIGVVSVMGENWGFIFEVVGIMTWGRSIIIIFNSYENLRTRIWNVISFDSFLVNLSTNIAFVTVFFFQIWPTY